MKSEFVGDCLEQPPPPRPTTTRADTVSSDRLRVPLNEKWIVQLESALQIYLYQNKKSSLSYANLCTLIPKLVLVVRSSAPVTTLNDDDDSDHVVVDSKDTPPSPADSSVIVPELQGLSTEERLWHDFACVTVPRLYTLVERRQTDSSKKTVLQLQMVYHANRPQELRRLLQQSKTNGVRQQLSVKILDWLQQDKIRREQVLNAKTGSSSSNEETTTSTLVDKMELSKAGKQTSYEPQSLQALEERVRAKAQERLRHMEHADKHAKTTGQQDDRIAVADAIYSHARKVLRQRKQGGSRFHTCTRPTKTSTQCKIPFSSLAEALTGYNRPQLSTVLHQIVEICPHWISWTVKGKDTKQQQAGSIPKNAIMSIETADYKKVRALLTGDDTTSTEPRESPSSVADQSPFVPVRLLVEGASAERTPRQFPTATLRAVTVSGNKRSSLSTMGSKGSKNPANNKKARGL